MTCAGEAGGGAGEERVERKGRGGGGAVVVCCGSKSFPRLPGLVSTTDVVTTESTWLR